MSTRIRIALAATLLTFGLQAAASAQTRIGGSIAGGYNGGLESPFMESGSWGVNGAIWLEKSSGIEFGFGVGYDRYRDLTTTTNGLFLDPSNGSISTSACAGCIAGRIDQRSRNYALYATPMIRLRQRTGPVRPWVAAGLGIYSVRDRDNSTFVPTTGTSPVPPFSNDTDDLAAGGNLTVGLAVPVGARLSIDLVTQVHGAFLVGDDYAGGTGYGRIGLGVTFR